MFIHDAGVRQEFACNFVNYVMDIDGRVAILKNFSDQYSQYFHKKYLFFVM